MYLLIDSWFGITTLNGAGKLTFLMRQLSHCIKTAMTTDIEISQGGFKRLDKTLHVDGFTEIYYRTIGQRLMALWSVTFLRPAHIHFKIEAQKCQAIGSEAIMELNIRLQF